MKYDITHFLFHIELNICALSEIDYCMRYIRHMELIVYQMLNDGKVVLENFRNNVPIVS